MRSNSAYEFLAAVSEGNVISVWDIISKIFKVKLFYRFFILFED